MQTDSELAEILSEANTVAVIGIKDREGEDAFRIPKYMQDHGYRIVPVNPKLQIALGETSYADLPGVSAAGEVADIVNLFRASDHVPAHVDEILAMSPLPKAVWMQLGIHHGASAARLREAGIKVVQDRCIMVDHRRLLTASEAAAGAS